MKILICDNDFYFIEEVLQHLRAQLPETTQLSTCQNSSELHILLSKTYYDLLLMDICLEEENGILLARDILEKYPGTAVIFVTGYPDLYYEKVFLNIRPYGFISKPVNWELLFSLIEKVLQERKQTHNSWLFIRTKNGLEKVAVPKISYIESNKHRIILHTKSCTFETYGRLEEIAATLPDYFFHCHKSFLVNANFIQRYDGNCFYMEDGAHIHISQLRRKEVRRKFMQYIRAEQLMPPDQSFL